MVLLSLSSVFSLKLEPLCRFYLLFIFSCLQQMLMSGYEKSLGQMSIRRSAKGRSFSGFASSTPIYYKNVINQLLDYWILLDLIGGGDQPLLVF